MKKNGYLRRFLALFLALVMIMADSSVTTFAATVGRVRQTGIDVTINAPDGTYYLAAMKNGYITSRVAQVSVSDGKAQTTIQPWQEEPDQIVFLMLTGENYDSNYQQDRYRIIQSGGILNALYNVSGGEINGNTAEISATVRGGGTVSNI